MNDILRLKNSATPLGSPQKGGTFLYDETNGAYYMLIDFANAGDTISTLLAANKLNAQTAFGDVDIAGDLTVGDDLTVTDDADIGGDLSVIGNATAATYGAAEVTDAELGYVDGATSNIQAQIDALAPTGIADLAYGQSYVDQMEDEVKTVGITVEPNNAGSVVASNKTNDTLLSSKLLYVPGVYSTGSIYSQKPSPSFGKELVTSGDMSDSANWTASSGQWVVANGIATATGNSTNSWISQTLIDGVEIGDWIMFKYTVLSSALTGQSVLQVGGGDVTNDITPNTNLYDSDTVGTHIVYWQVPATDPTTPKTNIGIRLASASTGGTIEITNVSIKQVYNVESIFTTARTDTTTRVNKDGYLETVAANVLAPDYITGDAVTEPHPASENLITYPISLGNSYWTKSGATIEGDESNKTTVYSSDFSVDVDGMSSTRVTSSGNNDAVSDGATSYDDVLKTYASVDNNTHYVSRANLITTNVIEKVSWKMYIPSGNTNVDDLRVTNGGTVFHHLGSSVKKVIDGTDLGSYNTSTGYITGAEGFWVEVILYVQEQSAAGTTVRWQHAKNGAETFIGAGSSSDDIIYFRDLLIEDVAGFQSPHLDYPTDAYKLVEDGSTGSHRIEVNGSLTAATTYTYSIYAKAGERTWTRIAAAANGQADAYFDLTNGVVGTVALGTAKIEALVNGWYKCSVTGTSNGTGLTLRYFTADADNSASYTGDGTSGLYLAFPQLEEQDYASPLMLPVTEGSTTTRTADAVTGAGDATLFSSVNSSGVLFFEAAKHFSGGSDSFLSISDGTASNRIRFGYSGTELYVDMFVGGVREVILFDTVTQTNFNKAAFRWKASDYSLWINGVEVATNTLSTLVFPDNTLNEVRLEDGVGTLDFYAKLKRLELDNYLSNAKMALLTT